MKWWFTVSKHPGSLTRSLVIPVLVGTVALVTACSKGPEDQLVELGQCYKAAKTFQDKEMLFGVGVRLQTLLQQVESKAGSKALIPMLINEKINDKLYPHGSGSSAEEAMQKLTDWHDSDRCKSLRMAIPEERPKIRPTVVVPQVDGVCKDIKQVLINVHLVPKQISLTGDPGEPDQGAAGCAYRQSPAAGTSVPEGTEVTYRTWWYPAGS